MTQIIIQPITITTTNKAGSTVTKVTSTLVNKAETTVLAKTTSTKPNGDKTVVSASLPATLVKTTNKAGNTVTKTSLLSQITIVSNTNLKPETTTNKAGVTVVLSGTRSGQQVTTTNANGRTVVLTYTPPPTRVSKVVVQTTVLPGGQTSTFTSFAYVPGQQASTSPSAGPTGAPALQSGSSQRIGWYGIELTALLGFALGLALMM